MNKPLFFTTKLTVEMTIKTQFGPANAIDMIDVLTRVPAIERLNIIKLDTDYTGVKYLDEDVNLKAINNIPRKIR